MTQKQLAERIGVAQSTIASWETEKREPDQEHIIKLASFFNTTTDYLLGRPHHTPSYVPITEEDYAEGYSAEEPTADEKAYIELEDTLSRVTDPSHPNKFRRGLARLIVKHLQDLRERWNEDIECSPYAILSACEGESAGVIEEFITVIEQAEKEYAERKQQNVERDIARELERIMESLDSDTALAFDGEPLDEQDKELLRVSLENSIRIARQLAKQKFTPKKYKKD
ncbi:hypothetical protein Alches_18360 [Alicyclobacillus hesperidum subsp. aegles]|nr:hypothetical protein Alches_18360 [Alicyclobacillus hesperidum subsp. aegles]